MYAMLYEPLAKQIHRRCQTCTSISIAEDVSLPPLLVLAALRRLRNGSADDITITRPLGVHNLHLLLDGNTLLQRYSLAHITQVIPDTGTKHWLLVRVRQEGAVLLDPVLLLVAESCMVCKPVCDHVQTVTVTGGVESSDQDKARDSPVLLILPPSIIQLVGFATHQCIHPSDVQHLNVAKLKEDPAVHDIV